MAKHPSKTVVWKLKNVWNLLYNKYMKTIGYTPTTFNFSKNRYNYEKQTDLDQISESELTHEIIGFKKRKLRKCWYKDNQTQEIEAGKQEALRGLRTGKDNEYIIRRSL